MDSLYVEDESVDLDSDSEEDDVEEIIPNSAVITLNSSVIFVSTFAATILASF